ncbi:MAG: response regulator [Myxococcales bacterium]|nr:response regulator [Myxococcales bacterium]
MGIPERDLLRDAVASMTGEGYFVLDLMGRYVAFNNVHKEMMSGAAELSPQIGEFFLHLLYPGSKSDISPPSHSLQNAFTDALSGVVTVGSVRQAGGIKLEFEIKFSPLGSPEIRGVIGRHPGPGGRRIPLAVEPVPAPIAQLSDGVLNELNNLGVGLSGVLETLNQSAAMSSGEAQLSQRVAIELLEQVRTRAERARRLGRTIRSQAMPSPDAEMDVDVWLADLEPKLQARAPGVKLHVERGLGNARIIAHTQELEDALFELVQNAAQAHADHIVVRSRLELSTSTQSPKTMTLEVEDDGEGICKERIDRVLEPYVGSRKHTQGIGLTRVKSIAGTHGGSVAIRSGPSGGTIVALHLPLSHRNEPETMDLHVETFQPPPQQSILVVDDAPEVRRVLGRVLRNAGHDVFEAEDGLDALEKLSERHTMPDLIILDLMMPRMDGIETYRELRMRSEILPILITSGYHPSSLDFLTTDGQARFLPKPFSPTEVLASVDQLLSK